MKKWLALLIVAVMLAALASGCGGGSTQKPAAVKDSIVVAQGTDVEDLDPHGIASTPSAIVTEHIFDTLVTLDKDFKIVPRLAESWQSSPDGKEWTFKLRKGVKFTDGTVFNAGVVKFNIERLLDPKVKVLLRSYINQVDKVEVIDEYTVKMILKYPHAPFLARLSSASNAMLSPAAVAKYGKDIARNPVGTGPYKVKEWVKGDKLVLERNDGYWGPKPAIKTIIFKPVPDNNTRLAMLEAGDADIIVRVPPVEYDRLNKNDKIKVVRSNSTREIYMGMNVNNQYLKDPRVRQALNHAVNKEEIVAGILKGAGKAVDSPLLPEMFPHKKVGAYEFNPAKAKQLLAEAGYPNGLKLTIHHPVGRYLEDKRVVEAIQGYLKNVGIDAELKTMEWAAYLAFVRKPADQAETQLFLMGWGPWILDGDQMLYPLFVSGEFPPGGNNYGFYKNDQVDALLKKGTSTTAEKDRADAYGKAQELIMKDAPWIFLHSEMQIVAMKKNLDGVVVLPIEQLRLAGAKWAQ